jgi:glyoxylase-like metal-dependent hydrolase (beta-lactamase superfamily II)
MRAGVSELVMHADDWERAQSIAKGHAERERLADLWLERNGFVPQPIDEGFAGRWELSTPTRLIGDAERVGRLESIWTPGHSPGHLCYVDHRSGRMLTGDHVLDPITPHIGVWRDGEGDAMGEYLASLAKVRGRGPGGALPAHGEPFPDLDRRVDELIAHTHARDAAVLAALDGGPADAAQIAARLPWTRRNRSFADLGEFHQQFAVSETIAHLQHLLTSGAVVQDATPEHIRYTRAG